MPAPTELLVRSATVNDIDHVLPLVRDFVSSFKLNEEQCRVAYNELLQDAGALTLVAQRGDTLVGYCLGFVHQTFYANGPVAWVEEIMVEASARRDGAGRALMQAFEAEAQARGAVLTALATRRAATFYEAIGYEESATYFRRLLPRKSAQ